MADIHILRTDESPNGVIRIEVAYHVVVPVALQPPGSASGLYPVDLSRESLVKDGLGAGELADIQNGLLVEEVAIWKTNRNARTLVQIREAIRANWHVVQADVDARLLARYRFYGATLVRT